MIHSQISLPRRLNSGFIFICMHLFPSSDVLLRWKKRNTRSIVDSLKQARKAGVSLDVDRRKNLSDTEFERDYLNPGLPVIFDGKALSWKCTALWNMDYLKTAFKHEKFSLLEFPGLSENDSPGSLEKISAKEFVDSIRNGGKEYLRFCPIMESNPGLKADLDQGWLKKMRKCFLGISYQSFLGPKGRKTPLHSDTTAFFYIMASGEKKWSLFSPTALPIINPEPAGKGYNFSKVNVANPDPATHPGFPLLNRYECILKPGDILFVPAWMWHEVENLSESWGISYRFTSLRGFCRFPLYVFVRIFLARPSFIKILYYSFFRSDLGKRNNNLLTPKVFLDE